MRWCSWYSWDGSHYELVQLVKTLSLEPPVRDTPQIWNYIDEKKLPVQFPASATVLRDSCHLGLFKHWDFMHTYVHMSMS